MRAALPAADPAPGVIARTCSQRVDTAFALILCRSRGSRNKVNPALTPMWEPRCCSGSAGGAARARRRRLWVAEVALTSDTD